MAKLKLTVACDKYDYLQPLRDGTVQAEGIDLNLITVESGIRHQRMYHHGEYDACEFSMSSYLVAKSQDVGWFHAIPFFPRRMFTHKFCFIRSGSGIKKPADLKGARIGLRSYENTLALITKGMFHNTYDLPVTAVTWVIINKEPVGSKLPSSIKVEQVEGKWRLEDLLLQGKVDAEAEPDLPEAWLRGEGTVERLFSDFEQDERDYYKTAKIFPIMHTLVLRESLLQKENDIAQRIHLVLEELKNDFYAKVDILRHHPVFPWLEDYIDDIEEIMGKDPWAHGIRENSPALNKFLLFSYSQGLLRKQPRLEELFVDLSTLASGGPKA